MLLWMFEGLFVLSNWVSFQYHGIPSAHFTIYEISKLASTLLCCVLTIASESLKLRGVLWLLIKSRYTFPVFPKTCCRILFSVAKFLRVSLWQCFHYQLFSFTKTKKKVKWNDLISQRTADKSTPPSAEGPQGLGERCCTARFSTTTWQVPGTMGFVRSKRETKHHLWNGILIDCCSHY